MKICFICRRDESLAIEYLSSFLKKAGFETTLVFDPGLFCGCRDYNLLLRRLFECPEGIADEALMTNADLYCFSVLSHDYYWACSVAKLIKAKNNNAQIIFGGIYPSSAPEKVIRNHFIDYVCVGEGEEALLELVCALQEGKDTSRIGNIVAKNNGEVIFNPLRRLIGDLDALPFPDKDAFFHKCKHSEGKYFYVIMTSRGCPYNCSYCYGSHMKEMYEDKGIFCRRRSVDNVIDELKWALDNYAPRLINFYDDVFVTDKTWLESFSRRYKQEIGLPSFCFVHPQPVDEEIISYLIDMNCYAVDMGIQTLNDRNKKALLGRVETNQKVSEGINQLKKTKIFLFVDVIVGLPYQGEEELLALARFLNEHKVDAIHLFWLSLYPKTKMSESVWKLNPFAKEDIHYYRKKEMAYIYIDKLGPLARLVSIANVLPTPLFQYMVNKRLYRFLPPLKYTLNSTNNLLMFMIGLVTRTFKRKRPSAVLSSICILRYYAHFIFPAIYRKIAYSLGGLLRIR